MPRQITVKPKPQPKTKPKSNVMTRAQYQAWIKEGAPE